MNLTNLLTSVRLTITQWLGITGAAVLGVLVIALKLQGSRLHKAQVDLLKVNMLAQDKADDAVVQDARDKFLAALKEYRESTR